MFIPPRLKDTVSPNGSRDEASVIAAKQGLSALGLCKPDHGGITGFPDRGIMEGIRLYQQKKGLFVDGTMEPDGPTERSMRVDLMKKQGLMPERPEAAFPLEGPMTRKDVTTPGDAAVVDGVLQGLGYMHATSPGPADRARAMDRALLKTLNRSFDGMTYGSPIHTKLAEQLAAKRVESELAAPDGSIDATKRRAGPAAKEGGPFGRAPMPPGRYAENWKREQALEQAGVGPAANLDDPMTPALITDLPDGIGAEKPDKAIGPDDVLTEAERAEKAERDMILKLWGFDPSWPNMDHPDLIPILRDMERIRTMSADERVELVPRIEALDKQGGKYVGLSGAVRNKWKRAFFSEFTLPPVLSDDLLIKYLEQAIGVQEAFEAVRGIKKVARRSSNRRGAESASRGRSRVRVSVPGVLTEISAILTVNAYANRERMYLLEIARCGVACGAPAGGERPGRQCRAR